MSNGQIAITVALLAVTTYFTRLVPFLFFPDKKETPPFVLFLGRALPFAIIGMLVIYCLKDVSLIASPPRPARAHRRGGRGAAAYLEKQPVFEHRRRHGAVHVPGPGGVRRMKRLLLLSLSSQYAHLSLAPWCLRAGLLAYGPPAHLTIVEGTVNQSDAQILGLLDGHPCDLLGLSCAIWNKSTLFRLLPALRRRYPRAKIVLGGPEVSFCAADILRQTPQVDGVLRGRGGAGLRPAGPGAGKRGFYPGGAT